MDKRIEKTWTKRWVRGVKPVAAVLGLVVVVYTFTANNSSGQSMDVTFRSITVSEVIQGAFEDTLTMRGTIRPQTTIYLDAVVGGRVEEKLVEQGEYVEMGQPLVRLSNAALQLDVISREAQISEQMNFLRNTQMQAETNRLDLRRSLLETENEIAHREREIRQSKPLVDRGMLPRARLQELEQDLEYQRGRRQLVLERQEQESQIRTLQLQQLEESALKLNENLQFARANLENLLVRAPQYGYLSELNVELGESKTAGERLGQIDLPGAYKVVVALDEYYLNKISLEMPARVRLEGRQILASISKIDSRVKNSEFIVEVNLPPSFDQAEAGIKRGQSIELEIVMGATPMDSLMIEKGAFASATGGNWIFVLNKDGARANRRDIRLGKNNKEYYQVLDGLDAGERVIVSSYNTFDNADVLKLD